MRFPNFIWMTVVLTLPIGCRGKQVQAAPAISVPKGCERAQVGLYAHSADGLYYYRAEDDGGTLTLWVERSASDGGVPVFTRDQDAGTTVQLERTPDGFIGFSEGVVYGVSGKACRVRFPAEVLACAHDELRLAAASTALVDESCRASAAPTARKQEHVLQKVSAPPLE